MLIVRMLVLVLAWMLAGLAHAQASSVSVTQSVAVCVSDSTAASAGMSPLTDSSRKSLPCGTDSSGDSMSLYLQAWSVSPGGYAGFSSVDPQTTAAFFVGAFSSVLLLYFVGAGVGAVLDLVRRG